MIEVTVFAGAAAGGLRTHRLDGGVSTNTDNDNNLIIRDQHGKFLAIFRSWESAQLVAEPKRPLGGQV